MKTVVFLGLFGCAFAAAAQQAPVQDQVRASFDRMFAAGLAPATAKAPAPKAPAMAEDPLRPALMAVLWQDRTAFHGPLVAQAPTQRVRQ